MAGFFKILKSTKGNIFLTNAFSYSYDISLTPIISSISPSHSTQGILTVLGSRFGSNISLFFKKLLIKFFKIFFIFNNKR